MEKRFYLGAALLALILLVGILTMTWLERANEEIVLTLKKTTQAAQSGDLEQAQKLAKQAQGRWLGCWKGFAIVADHRQMDEIDALFAKMNYYGAAGNREDFGACCARIGRLVEGVADDHRLTWWNLL